MYFHITGLPAARFEHLHALPDAELAARGILRTTADCSPGFPCRVSLQDAGRGERLLLLNYAHLPVASPYRSSHAIYVREGAGEARLAPNEVPRMLQIRLLSVRAFDAGGMMTAADVVQGISLAPLIESMFADPAVRYLHIHNAKQGCYAARADRHPGG
jgi:hypothetical protein